MAACDIVRLTTAFLCFFFSCLYVANCMNFDERFSLIKKGKEDSYFGFSVAQHEFTDPQDNKHKNVLFIGAPKDKREVTRDKVQVGGSIFSCDASTSADNDCELITAADAPSYKSSELVDDQWLGVTVASVGTNKKAVACAHRYVKDNAAIGSCFVLYPDLMEYSEIFESCSKKSYTNFMQDFGLCQEGMSAAVGKDDALVMGAPGSVFWQGAIFQTNISDATGSSSNEKISPYAAEGNDETGEQATATKAYTYNGYAVAMGRFDSTKKLYYVSGAPKSKNTGEIILFTATSDKTLRYEDQHIVQGKLEFSGYGSSLLVLDLNNDGFDDLIVGAPYYYKRNYGGAIYVYLGGPSGITSDSPYTEILSREMAELECEELRCEHARFGMSLTSLKDINEDGFEDFAVGAPYEGNGAVYIYHGSDSKEGFDTKYVQRISADDLPVANLRSFGYSVSGGMDLDDNSYPDLLVGAYESDAVVLLRSRPLIYLHPNITVLPLAIDLDSTDGCSLPDIPTEYKDKICITIELCLTYTSSIPLTPEIIYSLEAEPDRALARVELVGATDQDKRKIEDKTSYLNPSNETCVTEIAIMKDQSQFEDKLNPVSFQFSFGLKTDQDDPEAYPQSAIQDINSFPYLVTDGSDTDGINSLAAPLDFIKECGDDNTCYSNLQFTAELANLTKNQENTYELIVSDFNVLYVEMSVWNKDEPAYLTKVYLKLPVNVTYLGETSADGVTCQRAGYDLNYIECENIGNPLRQDNLIDFVVQLSVPKAYAETPDIIHNVTAFVNTSSTETTPLNDEYVMFFRVINKAEVTLGTNVIPDTPILCKGEPLGASAMADETDIGAAVSHNFFINNLGPGVVSNSYISIKWPYAVAEGHEGAGKNLLYLMRMPKITGNVGMECTDDDIREYVNPLNIKEVITPEATIGASTIPAYAVREEDLAADTNITVVPSRKRREALSRSKRATSSSVVTMSCQDDTAKCFEYKCKIGKLETKNDYVQITMEARLWESTLLSDYKDVDNVEIISWAQLTVPDEIVQDKSDDSMRAITRAIPNLEESASGKIQWWIILVAVLVGLLVLLILIFILYKLGFFRRRRMEDMQMYKAEKKNQAMLDDYKDDGY